MTDPVPPAAAPAPDLLTRLRKWGGSLLAGGLVLAKGAKLMKLKTLISMLIAVGAYALFWGWPFAVGFVLLIFIHEMGHALVLRQQGIRAGAPVFIPFVGAVIAMKELPRDAWVEALVGIGGPALGTVGAAACLGVAWVLGSGFWFGLASVGFLLNLFNMLPISPLDGGRITGVISRWLWIPGYVLGAGVWYVTRSPILGIILLLGIFQVWRSFKARPETYYSVPMRKRLVMTAAYFGLMAVMAAGMMVADAGVAAFEPELMASHALLAAPIGILALSKALFGRRV